MSGKSLNHRYIPGLDGIRALAVLAVIAYHFNFSWARGGFLGVDIFFVLSGYLITSTMLPLKGNQLTVSLKKFWIGRFRRLLPAAYVMIITSFVWAMLFHKELLHTLRGDALSSIFYSSNWWFIFHKLSYFDSFGSPSPLKNLWSLAIEEQFYVIWPLLLMIGLYVVKKQSKLAKIVFIGAICSALLMAILYHPGADPSRVYYGTDTRCFELLIGCWLALIWPMKRLSSQKLSINHMKKLNSISFISFTIFLVSIMYVDEFQTFLYRGGMFLFCLNAAVLIACVCHPVSILGRILAWKPLCWIGSRSYGIYLWHYPVMVLGTPIHEIGNPSYWRIALQLVLIVTIAECSYRFIEMPIRKEGFWAYYRKYFVFNKKKWGSLTFSRKVSTVMAPLFLLVFFTGITGVVGEGQQSSKDSYPTAIKINGDEPTANPIKEPDKTTDNPSPSKEEEVDVPDIETLKPEENETNVVPEKEDAYQNILAIGDSVMIDIATSLHKVFPNITIDGKIGRQVSQAVKLAPNYASFNQSNNAIIIQLGTNGYFTNDQIDTLLAAFANADIYLVNTRVPRSWEGKVNASLLQKSEEHENITLIDWHAAALNHPEYFAPDGVHLEKKGVEVLTNLIQQSINK
ncbi:acyltransferase family protein [Lysinibacillus fusiformis]|uniref:acyltransferase family protein n=1 Tax=Lysinibacillus fusiformis TaxID=28031 RepID=UPI0008818CB6|nr:acyltransferase family protein [Lysinibacillus fusiformis]SCX70107.1 peptidoglycan-N-acetylmuramate O-acetyltransferase [Lysinibacillus fusiformis]SDB59826.1 peptidoglycan-N-acetylmuramate O-acetyltransferase [Lysinibacillus fusiformis]SFJ26072.1 peptidoglycan-N-acetylmuramate O-acetyltransferase [Lysinibacillus fusiformis]SFT30480.1 peptidoglycan-N-acetylmuramate O-acetyltransferase [Lysinibacillus fusiformis]